MNAKPEKDEVLRRWRLGKATVLDANRRVVSGGVLFEVKDGCQVGDRFLLAGTTVVGATTVISDCASSVPLEVQQRADLAGRLDLPSTLREADRGLLRFRPCEPTNDSGVIEIPLALGSTGTFETAAPAGCFDLSAQVASLAPATWQGVTLKANKLQRLPTRPVRVGGALLARIVNPQTGHPVVGAKVALLPTGEVSAAVVATASGQRYAPLSAATTNEASWFRFAGLPPADYVLRIDDGRRWPFFSDPIGIRVGDEVFQPELELPQPIEVEVQLSADDSDLRGAAGALAFLGDSSTQNWATAASV